MSVIKLLRVIEPGFLTTIQDLGRRGFAASGVSEAGAADSYSFRIGNLLVGNPEDVAALEMTLVGGRFEILSDTTIAITGSDFNPQRGKSSLPMWQAVEIRKGEELSFRATTSGARCYLCVEGGVQVPPIMGSRSTHLLTRIGGFDGRPLMKGDVIETFPSEAMSRAQVGIKVSEEIIPRYSPRTVLRVVLGPNDDYFEKSSIERFLSEEYTVTEHSDRMGLRLAGPPLLRSREGELLSEGVMNGSVQVPANGLPIILFVEHPTTGGYPKVATVVSADLHLLGQVKPRDTIRFQSVSRTEAVRLLQDHERIFQSKVITHAGSSGR